MVTENGDFEMDTKLFDNTKLAAYFLWECTHEDNTFKLWRCAEDMAGFLNSSEIFCPDCIVGIIRLGVFDMGYIAFVRHIAYRIFIHTGRSDALANWFSAEKLISNGEWRGAITSMSYIYHTQDK
jgi:hypothetical protein